MSASTLKLPLLGMGVLLVAGVAAWVVYSAEDATVPAAVAPVTSRAEAPDQPAFSGGPADARSASTEALSAEPMAPAALAGGAQAGRNDEGALAASAPRATVELTGRVVDVGGRGIEGASVSFQSNPFAGTFRRSRNSGATNEAAGPSTTTGRDGSFQLVAELPEPPKVDGDLPFPSVAPQLAVRHERFATLVTPLPDLASGVHDAGRLVMDPGAWISGRVVDSKQRPVAGASVRARNDSGQSRGGRGGGLFFGNLAETLDSVTTGTDGRFTVRGLHEGLAGLTAQKQGLRLGTVANLELVAQVPHNVGDVVLEEGEIIAGVVLDDDGKPLQGVSVSVSSMARILVNRIEDLPRQQIAQEFGQSVTSDADGRFEVGGLAGGTYTVHVSVPGHEDLSREDVPSGTRNLRLVPVRLGSLLITLQDAAGGQLIDGARIKATHSAGDGEWSGWRAEVAVPVLAGADAVLAAGLDEPPAGLYLVPEAGLQGTRLVVAADGFATLEVEAPAAVSGQLTRFQVQLIPASVVAGAVLDARDEPVAGALVQLEADRPDEDSGISFGEGGREVRRALRIGEAQGGEEDISAERLTTRSAADGSFEIAGASAGDWKLQVSADGFVTSAEQPLTLALGQSQRDMIVLLGKAGTLAGLVTEVDGTPVADIEVTVTPLTAASAGDGANDVDRDFGHIFGGGGAEGERRARTQADGAYVIDGLEPGDYIAKLGRPRRSMNFGSAMVITMDGSDGADSSDPGAPAHIVAEQETRVDFVRPKRAIVSGRVLALGAPVADVSVTLRRAGGMPFGGERASTDDRGEYRFTDVEAGSYEVSARAPGAALERTQTVSVTAGQEQLADLLFKGSTLSGQVVDEQSGAGVEGVELTLVPKRDSSSDEPTREVMAFSFITSAGPGSGPGGGLNMTFTGGAASGARTDAQGRFELKYVEPGSYSLEASGAGYMRKKEDGVEVAENRNRTDLKLEVSRGGIVEGRVLSGSTGETLDKVPVRLVVEGDEQMIVTNDGGRFRFDGLEPGDYTVEALGSSFGSEAIATKSVKVKAGETASVDLSTQG